MDAYNAAFVLPELALDVLVASGLTAPFVPVFTSLRREGSDAPARFFQTVLTLAMIVMGCASILLLAIAPATVNLIAPGFDAENRARYTELFQLMLATPVIFAASITLGEVLVAERRFLYYALAPILYNLGIVAGTVLLHDRIGIRAAAVGALIGALLHLGIRVVGMLRTSVPLRFRLELRTAALREFILLMIPKMLSHPIEPLTFLFFTAVATTLAAGSVSAVSFARNFQSVPVALFGASIALAAFPGLSSRLGGRRPGAVPAPGPHERHDDHRARDARGGGPGRGRRARDQHAPRRRCVRRGGRPRSPPRCWPRSPSPSRSTRWATSLPGASMQRTTPCCRCSPPSPALRSPSSPRSRSCPRPGSWPSHWGSRLERPSARPSRAWPSRGASGRPPREDRRQLRRPSVGFGYLAPFSVGTTATNRPSRLAYRPSGRSHGR